MQINKLKCKINILTNNISTYVLYIFNTIKARYKHWQILQIISIFSNYMQEIAYKKLDIYMFKSINVSLSCKRLLQFLVLIVFMLCLQGCLNVNLKSALPNQTYYSLDNVTLAPDCKKPTINLALNVSVLSPYDGKDILVYNNDLEIKVLESYKWIDLPKNMIRNAFLKIGANNCLHIEQNTSVTQRINTLRLNFNEMYVKSQDDGNIASITLSYDVIGYDMNRIKSAIITVNAEDKNPAKALQKAMFETLSQVAQQLKGHKF